MTDTAQPLAAENVALDEAANAFLSFDNTQSAQPRDDQGRFASTEPEAAEIEDEEEEIAPAGEVDDDAEEEVEAADEAQPEAVDMPSSWGNDRAELWETFSPEQRAGLTEWENSRNAGVNAKLQEAANARKASEAQVAEANANRDAYARAIDEVIGLVSYPKPDPTQFGIGTADYDRESYELATYQWEQTQGQLQQLFQQRQAIVAQQEEEARRSHETAHREIEGVAWPKFLAEVPDLGDVEKGKQIVSDIVSYALNEGYSPDDFTPGNATSREMRMLWKAREYDRIKSAEKRVKAGNPPPKPAAPAVRPGGVTPRATVKANRLNKAQTRLAKEGSIEAGAEVFKHFL